MVEARRLLSQMQWDKVAPSIEIFNMLLRGYLRMDNVGAAQDVFRELEGSGTWDMESLGIKPDAASYSSLMDHWANQGMAVPVHSPHPKATSLHSTLFCNAPLTTV